MDTMRQRVATKRGADYVPARMITGAQIRAARVLLGWSSEHLASKAGVHYATISRSEQYEGVPSIRAPTLAAIQSALEAGGIIFLSAGDTRTGGAGVRLR